MCLYKSKPRKLVLISILFLSLACNLISNLQEGLEGIKSTAVSIATEAKGGQEMLATGQAIATQLAESQLAETAKAIATELGQSGAVETLQAMVTEQVPHLSETLQAFLTQEAPLLEETAKALLEQDTPIAPTTPSDIPIIEGKKENLIITKSTISYLVALQYSDVVSYYKREMPQNGWSYQADKSTELQNASVLNYKKDNRIATISINLNPTNQKTIVTIVIQYP